MTSWLLHGKEITPDTFGNAKAFVYLITNEKNGKQYYGKKRLFFVTRKKVKDRVNRKKVIKDSDWVDYYGSSKELHGDIEKFGKENFKREILCVCKTLGEASYWEIKYQLEHDVLLHPNKYYNTFVGCRIHRKHLGASI